MPEILQSPHQCQKSYNRPNNTYKQVVVGGGPTGVEFAGELANLVNRDLASVDNDRARDMRITLIEATELLGSFDAGLRDYAARKLRGAGVHLRRGVVQEVAPEEITLQGGDVIR